MLVLIAAWLDLDPSPDDTDTPPRAPIADSISAPKGPAIVSATADDNGTVAGEDPPKRQRSRSASDTADTVVDTLARIIETREMVGRWGPSSVAPPPGLILGEGRLGDPDEVLRFRASRDGVVLLGRDLNPVGEPIPLTDPDSTDAR